MPNSSIEQAREAFKDFENFPNEPKGREALAEGLAVLLEVIATTSSEKDIEVCNNLIKIYRNKIDTEARRLIEIKSSLNWEFLQHWQGVMAEFQALDIDVPEDFRKLESQLKIAILVKQIQQWSSTEIKDLKILLEEL